MADHYEILLEEFKTYSLPSVKRDEEFPNIIFGEFDVEIYVMQKCSNMHFVDIVKILACDPERFMLREFPYNFESEVTLKDIASTIISNCVMEDLKSYWEEIL